MDWQREKRLNRQALIFVVLHSVVLFNLSFDFIVLM
ncbi:hypothetical protein SAMN05877842_10393 [Ureibacillus acetophenoni]|uniref:Uncharacterized protein n=1 Tax=Ureibacillus acetophenoni TaxID=614649 RepID=A0A285UA68_9BACL|nr:hypothetical protein SAMN05877842_10393 [Ureibacillus acetophenoni]